jgi:hypothetical protein
MKTKRLISYSIWGNQNKYLVGAMKNIELARKHYPGWVVRFYYQADMDPELINRLKLAGAEVRPKGYFKDPWIGLYWRFCPMYDDESIERFIVRDTDSPISAREADAVHEWIASGMPFHIMRDNTAHNIEILGGMWGSISGIVPNFEAHLKAWIATVNGDRKNPMGRYHGTDQDFLRVFVWPVVKNKHIAHGIKYLGNEHPFRIINPGNYKVGTYPDAETWGQQ